MNRISKKRMWLAGASLLAIVLGSGDANAIVFGMPGSDQYVVPSTGWYDFRVAGAQGGGVDGFPGGGGAGALVGGELFLDAGITLDLLVGGENGGQMIGGNGSGGGGGGGTFVFGLFAAGGGAGAAFAGSGGGPGIGSGGTGTGSYNGAGGLGVPTDYPFSGPDYLPGLPAEGGSFPNGGQGAQACFPTGSCFTVAPMGGCGGGGGGGYNGGGGGGGDPGGAPGQGGYSFVTDLARDPFGITGGNPGPNGYVSIEFVAVPEPSTWAMMLAGFSALGGMLFRRGRKGITPT
jgi:PEP-CTERM motif